MATASKQIVEVVRKANPEIKRVCLFSSDEMATAYLFSELRLMPGDFNKYWFGFEEPDGEKGVEKES